MKITSKKRFKEIKTEGNLDIAGGLGVLRVDGDIKAGNITIGKGTHLHAVGDIHAVGHIDAGGHIVVGGYIHAGGDIHAGGHIDADGDIDAGGDIWKNIKK